MFDVKDISIREMLLWVLLKWRLIVVVAVILSAVTPIVINAIGQRKTTETQQESDSEQDPISFQITNISLLADLYSQSYQIEERLKWNSQLGDDNGTLRYVVVQYYIEPEKNKEGKDIVNSKTIGSMFGTFVISDSFVNSLLETINTPIDPELYRKYIETETDNDNLTIKIPCPIESDEDKLATVIKKMINDKVADSQNNMKYVMNLINEGFRDEQNEAILKERKDLNETKNKQNTLISSAIKGMSDDQIDLAKELAEGMLSEDEIRNKLITISPDDAGMVSQTGFGVQKVLVFALIGMIAGVLVVTVGLCEVYVISVRLHSKSELTRRAGIMVMGALEIPDSKHMTKIDELIRFYLHSNKRRLSKAQQISDVVTALCLYLRQNSITSICFTSSSYSKDIENLSFDIIEEIRGRGVESKFVDSIVYNKESLLACSQTNGIVIFEQLDKSFLSEIENEILIAKGYELNILGAIVFE